MAIPASGRAHPLGVGHRAHVAVAEDRDALDRLDHRANAIVLDAAGKALGARAAVDGHRGDPDLLELAREKRSALVRVIPAQAHLHGHRDLDRLHDTLHQLDGAGGVAQQGRAATAAGHLVDGAAHVDVDR
jgi:hypothetical protein